MRRVTFAVAFTAVLAAALPAGLFAQADSGQAPPASDRPGYRALNLGVHGVGLSIGNSRRWTGLRINFRDNAVEQVNGLNLTIWAPQHNETMVLNGVAVGIAGPVGGTFNGVTIGGIGAVAERGFHGVTLAGLGAVSNGDTRGLTVAGLGVVSNGDMTGINVSGLGTVANRSMRGLNLAGLGVVADGDLGGINVSGLGTVANGVLGGVSVGGLAVVGNRGVWGITAGGLAVVSDGAVDGVSVAGLAVVGNGRVRGISAAGLAVVTDQTMTGLAVAGLAVVGGQGLRGVAIGGVHVEGRWIEGLAISPIRTRTWDMTGVSIAGYNRIKGGQRGLTIGIYNYAKQLHGVQLGLINNARNNRGILRVLPLINVHLD
ncbi:MAG TPA: hypothetical protein VLB49_06115 [Gemmatimonadales bacterium]|nr:hypothetical protein [Gemmatimonadales bacterium]